MREELERRLEELRAELEVGQKVAAELDVRQANLRATMLRIGGAIQVLEELLGQGADAWRADGSAVEAAPMRVAAE